MARHDEKTSAGRAKMLSRGDTGDRLAEADEVVGCRDTTGDHSVYWIWASWSNLISLLGTQSANDCETCGRLKLILLGDGGMYVNNLPRVVIWIETTLSRPQHFLFTRVRRHQRYATTNDAMFVSTLTFGKSPLAFPLIVRYFSCRIRRIESDSGLCIS